MTKEELEKKRDQESASLINMTDGSIGYCPECFKSGFDSAVALLLPRLEMAIRFLTILDNELNVSATGLSLYKNEGTHRSIKAAIRELKGEENGGL